MGFDIWELPAASAPLPAWRWHATASTLSAFTWIAGRRRQMRRGLLRKFERMGRQALFFNVNAADPERRSEVIEAVREMAEADPGCSGIRCAAAFPGFRHSEALSIAAEPSECDQAGRHEHDAGCYGPQPRVLDSGSVCGGIAQAGSQDFRHDQRRAGIGSGRPTERFPLPRPHWKRMSASWQWNWRLSAFR